MFKEERLISFNFFFIFYNESNKFSEASSSGHFIGAVTT